jgi:hypothetical protein
MYKEWRTGGEARNPDDRWTDYETEYIEFTPTSILTDRESAGVFAHGLMDDEVKGEFARGDIGHLLVVRYSTGDTFSDVRGYWTIIGFYKDAKEAVEIKDKINDSSYEGYKPWVGYFESLEDVELHTMVVQ